MPPAISDEETSNVDEEVAYRVKSNEMASTRVEESETEPTPEHIPQHTPNLAVEGDAQYEHQDGEGEVEDGDEEEGEGVYAVEAIKDHLVGKDGIRFHVKWEGYDDESDMTWEPEENLIGSASDILNAYYGSVGGRDYILGEQKNKKKRGRPSTTGTPDSKANGSKRARKSDARHPASTTPPASLKLGTFKPPPGSWEDLIQGIDACEGTNGEVMVFLQWSNGNKTQHPLHVVYKRCPQKMLKFYESHLSFTPATLSAETSTDIVLESSKREQDQPKKRA